MFFSKRSISRLFSSRSSAATNIFAPSSEHVALRSMIRKFAKEEVQVQANGFNKAEKFNFDLYRKCGALGILGLTVDSEYGGSALDSTAVAIIHEELSAYDPAFCLSYLAHSLLFVNNLSINGNDTQKHKYLPDACSGKLIGGMGMSEPHAGTDVLGMSTVATKTDKGYLLNGKKTWITNGCIDDNTLGDVFLIYAKQESSKIENKKLSLFIVDKGTPGFKLGQRIKDKLGMRASPTAELFFDNVELPAESLVGTSGEAVLCMMRNLEIERLGLAAMSCGIAKRCVEEMVEYGRTRKAFGKEIASFGQIQRHIGRSYSAYLAGRSLLYNVAANLDLKEGGNRIDTDAVKLFCSAMAKDVADSAIQVLGGNGYIGTFDVERLWRDAKLLEIGGGTSESHEKNITKDLARHFKEF